MSAPDLETLVSHLAVSGRFDPRRLLREVPEEQIDAFSARLAEACEEDLAGGRYRWVLRASARRAALERLGSKDALRRALAEAPAITRGDRFAAMLRAALTGKLPPVRSRDDPALEEARQAALQFARHVPALPDRAIGDALDDTRMRIASREREDALSIVFGRGSKLFGRRNELLRIRRFVEGRSRDVQPLLVTGVGGVGKSTLLAAVIRAWARRRVAPAVVLLDFDRPALSSGDPIEIAREFTRQLSFEWITSKTLPKRLRHEGHRILRDKRAPLTATYETGGEVHRVDAESQFSRLESLLFHPLLAELPAALRKAPIVLVMDTFEIVGRQGAEVTRRVLDLEAALRNRAGFVRLRTIVSGRGVPLPEDQAVQHFGSHKRWLKLEGMEEEAAAAFLADRDRRRKFRSKAMRLNAARALRGHPLALLVLERYARQRSAAEVGRLLHDVERDPGFSAEFAQTFLYARILERVGDRDVRALAHPGLVLRFVTPGLIRLVLAGPCGIGPVSEADSVRLFDKLKGEYWLVEIVDAGLVRHRPDLRRLMLPGLFAAPRPSDSDEVAARKQKLRAAAAEVCRAARDFYRAGPPATDPAHAYWAALSPRARLAEQFYYDALSGMAPPFDLSREAAADIRSELREDVDTMPEAWRATINATLGDALRLTEDEVETLGGSLRESVESARIDADLRQGETARARGRAQKARARRRAEQPATIRNEQLMPTGRASREDLELIEKEVLASFADAGFDEVRKAGRSLIHALGQGIVTETTRKSALAGRLWDTALWKAVLVRPWGELSPGFTLDAHGLSPFEMPSSVLLLAIAGAPKPHPVLLERPDFEGQGLDHTRLLAAYLARGIADMHSSDRFRVEADTLAVGTLVRRRSRSRESGEPFVDHMRLGSMLARFIEEPPVRALRLEELELLYQGRETIELDFRPQRDDAGLPRLLENLRGLTPELYHPTRHVLLDVGEDVARTLARELAVASRLWPHDLRFDERGMPAYTERQALPLIETADRLGLLRSMLESLARRDPRGSALLAVYDGITERFFTPMAPAATT